MKDIACYAYAEVPFYRDLYRRSGVDPSDLQRFSDIQRLPVVTKELLREVPLERRAAQRRGRQLANTGGSSGEPLEFYIEPSSVPHEWAHMHAIWESLGYRQSDLRLTFGGRTQVRGAVAYDSARHQYNVDIQQSWPVVAEAVHQLVQRRPVRYLHGYPSAIFDLILWLEGERHPVRDRLADCLRGVFLGSEHPSPVLRRQVEQILGVPTLAFYGHTERAVLGGEHREQGVYHPMVGYGFAEAVPTRGGRSLVATSYYNRASPFIRYDTGDLVSADEQHGLLGAFEVTTGRQGEFIIDAQGEKVFLTGLVFGRHHDLFHLANHVQVRQEAAGSATILVVPRSDLSVQAAADAFDSRGVDVDFHFELVAQPHRTPAGKVPLLIPSS